MIDAARPKRHHDLPQFYLEGFTDATGFLSLYDRSKREYRRQQPINTLLHDLGHRGNKHHDVEMLLSAIESQGKPAISALINQSGGISDQRDPGGGHR